MEHSTLNQIKLNDGAKNYSSFIQSFTSFILHYFKTESTKRINLHSFEKILTESLLLLEKLHLHLFYSFSIYEKYFNTKNPLRSDANYRLLQQLRQKIKNHSFLNDDNKELCERIISQILNYYPQSDNKIKIILSPISPPWIADL